MTPAPVPSLLMQHRMQPVDAITSWTIPSFARANRFAGKDFDKQIFRGEDYDQLGNAKFHKSQQIQRFSPDFPIKFSLETTPDFN